MVSEEERGDGEASQTGHRNLQRYKTAVRTAGGVYREFEIKVGLHQGSALSPLLFAVIIDVLSEHLRAENLLELLFADDLVIMADTARNN